VIRRCASPLLPETAYGESMNLKFSRNEHGYARVEAEQVYKPLVSFLEADLTIVAWAEELIADVERAMSETHGYQFVRDGNATEVTVTREAVVIHHDYVGIVTIAPREFVDLLQSWVEFLRSS
jgi:hypothetical protein